MTEIRFYHLMTRAAEQALPQILQKALEGGRRIVVKTADEKQVNALNDYLWTFRPDSFLPHGSKRDGFAESQPVWLTSEDENPNSADTLILINGAAAANIGDYALCCEMFDGRDGQAVKAARERWKAYKESGHDLTYWQQTEKGGWEKKV